MPSASSIAMTMYPGTVKTDCVLTRKGWSSAWSDWSDRSSRAVVPVLALTMNLRATGGPAGLSASHTSANPPRPRTRLSR